MEIEKEPSHIDEFEILDDNFQTTPSLEERTITTVSDDEFEIVDGEDSEVNNLLVDIRNSAEKSLALLDNNEDIIDLLDELEIIEVQALKDDKQETQLSPVGVSFDMLMTNASQGSQKLLSRIREKSLISHNKSDSYEREVFNTVLEHAPDFLDSTDIADIRSYIKDGLPLEQVTGKIAVRKSTKDVARILAETHLFVELFAGQLEYFNKKASDMVNQRNQHYSELSSLYFEPEFSLRALVANRYEQGDNLEFAHVHSIQFLNGEEHYTCGTCNATHKSKYNFFSVNLINVSETSLKEASARFLYNVCPSCDAINILAKEHTDILRKYCAQNFPKWYDDFSDYSEIRRELTMANLVPSIADLHDILPDLYITETEITDIVLPEALITFDEALENYKRKLSIFRNIKVQSDDSTFAVNSLVNFFLRMNGKDMDIFYSTAMKSLLNNIAQSSSFRVLKLKSKHSRDSVDYLVDKVTWILDLICSKEELPISMTVSDLKSFLESACYSLNIAYDNFVNLEAVNIYECLDVDGLIRFVDTLEEIKQGLIDDATFFDKEVRVFREYLFTHTNWFQFIPVYDNLVIDYDIFTVLGYDKEFLDWIESTSRKILQASMYIPVMDYLRSKPENSNYFKVFLNDIASYEEIKKKSENYTDNLLNKLKTRAFNDITSYINFSKFNNISQIFIRSFESFNKSNDLKLLNRVAKAMLDSDYYSLVFSVKELASHGLDISKFGYLNDNDLLQKTLTRLFGLSNKVSLPEKYATYSDIDRACYILSEQFSDIELQEYLNKFSEIVLPKRLLLRDDTEPLEHYLLRCETESGVGVSKPNVSFFKGLEDLTLSMMLLRHVYLSYINLGSEYLKFIVGLNLFNLFSKQSFTLNDVCFYFRLSKDVMCYDQEISFPINNEGISKYAENYSLISIIRQGCFINEGLEDAVTWVRENNYDVPKMLNYFERNNLFVDLFSESPENWIQQLK